MRDPVYADDLERRVGEALGKARIRFIHESQGSGANLDFLLPDQDICIEVKRFDTPRVIDQLKRKENIILLQGRKSVSLFEDLLNKIVCK